MSSGSFSSDRKADMEGYSSSSTIDVSSKQKVDRADNRSSSSSEKEAMSDHSVSSKEVAEMEVSSSSSSAASFLLAKQQPFKKQRLNFYGDYRETKCSYNSSSSSSDEGYDAEKENDFEEESYGADDDEEEEEETEVRELLDKVFSDTRVMTAEEMSIYDKMVVESEGFDAPHFPKTFEFGQIRPIVLTENKVEALSLYSNKCLEKFNMDNGRNYQLKSVLKANFETQPGGLKFYITFKASDVTAGPDVVPETFQAKIFDGTPYVPMEVLLCRKSQ